MKKKFCKLVILAAIAITISWAKVALATEETPTSTESISTSTRHITLRIEGPTANIMDIDLDTPENCYILGSGETTSTLMTGFQAVCALQKAADNGALQSYKITNWGDSGYFLDEINGVGAPSDWSSFWTTIINNVALGDSLSKHVLNEGDNFLIAYVPSDASDYSRVAYPLILTSATTSVKLNESVSLNLNYYKNTSTPLEATSTIFVNNKDTYFTVTSSAFSTQATATGTLTLWAESNWMIRSKKIVLTIAESEIASPAPDRHINLRIEGPTSTILATDLDLPEKCYVRGSTDTTTTLITGYKAVCALQKAVENADLGSYIITNFPGLGYSLDAIAGVRYPADWSAYWGQLTNNKYNNLGIASQELREGDNLLVAYVPSDPVDWNKTAYPITITASSTSLQLGEQVLINLYYFNGSESLPLNATTTIFVSDSANTFTVTSSEFSYQPTATGTISIWAESSWKIRSAKLLLSVGVASTTPSNTSPATETNNSGGSGSGSTGGSNANTNTSFDSTKAIQYLTGLQNADGSTPDNYQSDIVALAFGAYGGDSEATQKLKNYLLQNPPVFEGMNKSASMSRRAIALMSLGINPYNGTPTNYIANILATFDGQQFGLVAYTNDDIFALIVLLNAGYTINDDVISKTVTYILSKQNADGSIMGLDNTAAAIQVLSLLRTYPGVSSAIEKGMQYIKSTQNNDASFSDKTSAGAAYDTQPEFSTTWVIPAIYAAHQNESMWTKNGFTLSSYLATLQNSEGYVNTNGSKLQATAYALPAALHKTWDEILANFAKPVAEIYSGGGASNQSSAAETSTSTLTMPTSTIMTLDTPSSTTEISTTTGTNQSTQVRIPTPGVIETLERFVPQTTTADSGLDTIKKTIAAEGLEKVQNTLVEEINATTSNPLEMGQLVASTPQNVTPVSKTTTAKRVFEGSVAVASTLGAYLAWRLIQTLI